MIAHNQPSPVSNLTTTYQVDTDFNNDGYTNSFATTREQNQWTPKINDTNTTTTKVQPNLNPRILEQSHSTPTAPLKLTQSGKYYPCFQIDRETAQTAQCTKSRALTKLIDSIIDIESFDQKYVVVKCPLQSEQLKQNIVTIGVYQ